VDINAVLLVADLLIEIGGHVIAVGAHQARITDHVGRENCRELTVDAFFRHE
jgi:hypothetical protein